MIQEKECMIFSGMAPVIGKREHMYKHVISRSGSLFGDD